MSDTLTKMRPDRDLQCYFEQPSAVAALSATSEAGFTVSGTWRQQFDWCVIEWHRDNQFEHPAFRNLPDGNLSGLRLSYEESRENCIPIDCDLYPTVDWPYLRVWPEGTTEPYRVRLRDVAAPVEGEYQSARAEFELTGTITAGDYVGLSWLDEQYNYQTTSVDTLGSAAAALAGAIEALSARVSASASGSRITLRSRAAGENWNRIGAYGFVSGTRTEAWTPGWAVFSGGQSPSKWRIEIDFSDLRDVNGAAIPTTDVRKLRWTYAAGWQRGEFQRSEFAVRVVNWSVSGDRTTYAVAGPRSMRIEDDTGAMQYSGAWQVWPGNYSGGTLHVSNETGAAVSCEYEAGSDHKLYLGALTADAGGPIAVRVDGAVALETSLHGAGEERKVRLRVGEFPAGRHTVTVTLAGSGHLYFDFLEAAVVSEFLPQPGQNEVLTAATDWDTDHSLAVAPERTAWMIASAGLGGRANHYVGAMWFYELVRKGHQYASGRIDFAGEPTFGARSEIAIARAGKPDSELRLVHVHRIGDTAETVARAFELEINRGYTAARAFAEGGSLRLFSRTMGSDGNLVTIGASTTDPTFSAVAIGPTLGGGTDGEWRTDTLAVPRLNRAARDWHRSYFAALRTHAIDVTAAFSMELRHGDPSPQQGIAQRCRAGDAVLLPTPALQTNFSQASRNFWKPVYREMADIMASASVRPYLQFGEVQWWYFREQRSGMPYYDEETRAAFQARFGRDMSTIADEHVSPADYPDEAAFLSERIGEFTREVMSYVRETHPACRFEVLYPLDVNEGAWNCAVNYPGGEWCPANLDCLKTESFGFTFSRDLNRCADSIREPMARGFARSASAHLIGLGDPKAPWRREAIMAFQERLDSVVLWALDQLCLIGYALPAVRMPGSADSFGA